MRRKRKKMNSELLFDLLKLPEFMAMSDDLKIAILEILKSTFEEETKGEARIVNDLFENHTENTSVCIVFLIAVCLILVGTVCFIVSSEYTETTNMEFWQMLGSIISNVLRCIFSIVE